MPQPVITLGKHVNFPYTSWHSHRPESGKGEAILAVERKLRENSCGTARWSRQEGISHTMFSRFPTKLSLATLAALVFGVAPAHADLMAYDFSFNPNPDVTISGTPSVNPVNNPFNFTFSMLTGTNANSTSTANNQTIGCTGCGSFVLGTDTISSAVLTINLTDPGGTEDIEIDVDSFHHDQGTMGSSLTLTFTGGTDFALSLLENDGLLAISLTQQSLFTTPRSFVFASATLRGEYDHIVDEPPPPTPIPEPGSIALVGVGLLGYAAIRRRKRDTS